MTQSGIDFGGHTGWLLAGMSDPVLLAAADR